MAMLTTYEAALQAARQDVRARTEADRKRTGQVDALEVYVWEFLAQAWRGAQLFPAVLVQVLVGRPSLLVKAPQDGDPGYDRDWHEDAETRPALDSSIFPGVEVGSPAHHILFNLFMELCEDLGALLQAEAAPLDPQTCAFCGTTVASQETAIQADWTPYFHRPDGTEGGTVCAACTALRLRPDAHGEMELAA